MITIHCADDTKQHAQSEYEAAEQIKEMLLEYNPKAGTSPHINLDLIIARRFYGEINQEIDIILIYEDLTHKDYIKNTESGFKPISFVCTVEVKDHSGGKVRFSGNRCEVLYKNSSWSDVNSQSDGQKYALKNFLNKNKQKKEVHSVWIDNLIFFKNVSCARTSKECGKEPNIFVCYDNSWADLIEKICKSTSNKYVIEHKCLNSLYEKTMRINIIDLLVPTPIEFSEIDRKQFEKMVKDTLTKDMAELVNNIGYKTIIFKGKGGTGKTTRLIQLAYQHYKKNDGRILFLTYNNALISNLNRLMSAASIRNNLEYGIGVMSIYQFMSLWLKEFGICENRDANFYHNYENYKDEFLNFIKEGAINQKDIEDKKRKNSFDFLWDVICINEAQDWPENERKILYYLYGHKNFIIADGDDQLIRNQFRNNWKLEIPKEEFIQKNLSEGLRLKSKLCFFANEIAKNLDYDWQVKRIGKHEGGKLVLWIGNKTIRDFINYKTIIDSLADQKNKPADMLICMPPRRADQNVFDWVKDWFNYWTQAESGYWKFWDGSEQEIRRNRTYEPDEIRVVQYESCRGLEGWTTICLYLDDFFDYCKDNPYFTEAEIQRDFWVSDEELAYQYACQWLMIPLSRAIDTLVIHINSEKSFLGRVLIDKMKHHFDEIIGLDDE